MWSQDPICCLDVEDVELGNWGMRLPELTGGGDNSLGVRVVAMPLVNGVFFLEKLGNFSRIVENGI